MMLNEAFLKAAGIRPPPLRQKSTVVTEVDKFDSIDACDQLRSPRTYARRMAKKVENGLSLRENTYWLTEHAKRWAKRQGEME